MDLNIYNIHFIVGLFGVPKSVEYLANIQRDVDTSGIFYQLQQKIQEHL